MSDILELDRLSKSYGDVTGVVEASLGVADGAFVTLLGPSGCGKSTLLRMVGGFETPTAGRVLLDGEDLTDRPPHRRPVNMVFQDYALFPHLSVGKNVGYGLRVQRGRDKPTGDDIRRRAAEALELVGLAEKVDAAPHELSGGQRQRVALARALVRRPRVLLLDEPLSALDANLRDAMQVELRRLHDEVGLTFVMVTHDQSEALTLSDRVVVMRDGRIVQEGTPDELYETPANAWVASFVGHTNLFESVVRREGDELRVRCHGQPLSLSAESRVGADSRARTGESPGSHTFGFRPEGAELVSPDAAASNVLRGRVVRTLYRGHGVRLLLELDGGEIAVDLPMREAGGRTRLPARGELVGVAVPAHRIMTLDADAAGSFVA